MNLAECCLIWQLVVGACVPMFIKQLLPPSSGRECSRLLGNVGGDGGRMFL